MSRDTTSGGHATMLDGNDSSHKIDETPAGVSSDEVIVIDNTNMATKEEDCDRPSVATGQDRADNGTRSSESFQSRSSCSAGVTSAKKNDSAAEKIGPAQCAPTADQARRASTTSRFKEKRPEPLKLSSNMNQDIPLDLSVKSAGNIPSGVLGNIFNLDPLNPLAPLDTPRIQWQDNDSLLAATKSRLFSSSTNASHRARISSVMGESPPITPNTPLMDVMFSSTAAASLHRLPSDPSYSAILALESPLHSFLTSPFDLDKLHILDKLSQPSKQDYQLSRIDVLKGVPRRSCSSDNLQHLACGLSQVGRDDAATVKLRARQDYGQPSNSLGVTQKKNSISPLATRSLSNTNSEFNSPTKFSYTNQQTTANPNESHHSPTSNSNGKSLTPTSAATVNLFNIHLNSPNSSSRQSPVDPNSNTNSKLSSHQKNKSPSFPSLDQETCILDTPSMLYSNQQQNSTRTPLLGFSLNSNSVDQNNNPVAYSDHYNRQQSNPSINSNATLNTPTLISPSQMIANQLGLLPSPTLSPMSSVFDIPSPFLMFSSSAAQANFQQQSLTSISGESKPAGLSKPGQNLKTDAYKRMRSDSRQTDKNLPQPNAMTQERAVSSKGSANETIKERTRTDGIHTIEHDLMKNDLSQLITPADEKTAACSKSSKLDSLGQNSDMDHDVDMAIEDETRHLTSSANIPTREVTLGSGTTRPSTVIPHICISYHTHTKSLSNLQENQQKTNKLSNQPSAMSDSNCLDMLESNNPNGVRNHGRHRERDLFCKRSLSPRTFHARVRSYHIERLESSSAPPDVHQRRRRSKIKTATAANTDSCFELTNNNNLDDKTGKITTALTTSPDVGDKPVVLSQSTSCLNQAQNCRNTDRPYPEMPTRLTAVNHQFASQTNVSGGNSFWNGRSSSAGPAIYGGNHTQHKIAPCTAPDGCPKNLTTTLPVQSAGDFYTGQANPNFTAQQEQRQQAPSHQATRDFRVETNQRFQAANPSHQQLHYHSSSNQHFQNTTHTNNYDHHNHDHHHHQRPYDAQQLYSMSNGELQRLQYPRSGCQTQQQQLSISNIGASGRADQVALPQGITSTYHQNNQQIQNHNHNIQQQQQQQQQQSFHHGGVQIMPAPVGSMTNWSSASHRLICESQFSNQNSNLTQTNSLMNQIGLQPAAAQMLGRKFDTTNLPNSYEPMAHVNGPGASPSEGQAPGLACSNSMVTHHRGAELVDQPSSHIIDIESRSESRSNSSLDFASSFAGSNGSRSNSAAGSNLSAKKYHCDQCSKSFTRSDMLTRHRRLHSGDRPFQCTECKQEFSRSDHLSTHMRTHTGEKPYKCKLCSYSACRKDMITRHLKVHNRSQNLTE